MKCISKAVVSVFLFLALLIVPLWAQDPGAENSQMGCKLQGAWFTQNAPDFGAWMMTFNGKGDNKGTTVWDFPIADNPPGTSWTTGMGIWAKSGNNEYDYTYQSYMVDDDGNIVQIGIQKGTITLTGCNTAEIFLTAEFYFPGEEEPYYIVSSPARINRLLMNQSPPIQ